jgi:hypothetical protein
VASARLWLRMPEYSRRRQLGRAGSVIILLFAIASAGDYPLRVPSIAVVAVLAAIWMANAFCRRERQP